MPVAPLVSGSRSRRCRCSGRHGRRGGPPGPRRSRATRASASGRQCIRLPARRALPGRQEPRRRRPDGGRARCRLRAAESARARASVDREQSLVSLADDRTVSRAVSIWRPGSGRGDAARRIRGSAVAGTAARPRPTSPRTGAVTRPAGGRIAARDQSLPKDASPKWWTNTSSAQTHAVARQRAPACRVVVVLEQCRLRSARRAGRARSTGVAPHGQAEHRQPFGISNDLRRASVARSRGRTRGIRRRSGTRPRSRPRCRSGSSPGRPGRGRVVEVPHEPRQPPGGDDVSLLSRTRDLTPRTRQSLVDRRREAAVLARFGALAPTGLADGQRGTRGVPSVEPLSTTMSS